MKKRGIETPFRIVETTAGSIAEFTGKVKMPFVHHPLSEGIYENRVGSATYRSVKFEVESVKKWYSVNEWVAFLPVIGSSMRLFMRSENNLATNPDGIVKSPFNVIPAKTGSRSV